MKHLFFASHFEAKPFILNSMRKINESPEVFEDTYRVIIIGTGLSQSAANTARYLEKYKFSEIDCYINLGIAGSTAKNTIGQVHAISKVSIFCEEEIPETSQAIWQKSYPVMSLKDSGKKLATSLFPVWGEKFHSLLQKQDIDLVDMEAYSFVQVCSTFGITPEVYKSVSDNLTKKSQNNFLQNAQLAIDSLYNFYRKELN